MAGRKPTIFQRLNNIFGPDGVNVPKSTTNRYTIGNDALIKTQDNLHAKNPAIDIKQCYLI